MSPQKSPRAAAFELARLSVENAANDGSLIAATVEAERILALHPDSYLSLKEIETEIARLALLNGVVVEFGPKPKA